MPRRSRLFYGITVTLVVIACVCALPVLIPLSIAQERLGRHRLRSAAKKFACTSCGNVLGLGALDEADRRWLAHLADLYRRYPGAHFRLVRLVRAVCLSCGAMYDFSQADGRFAPIDGMQHPDSTGPDR